MQPLDVAFYAPLKKYWREILSAWKKTEGLRVNTLSKDSFPRLLLKLQNKLELENKGSTNIISGFRKTGLYPVDPTKPKERLPRTVQDEENVNRSVSEVVVDILANLRKDAAPTATPRQRRKRLQIPPGKSVSLQDFQEPSTSKGHTAKNQEKEKCTESDSDTTTEDVQYSTSEEEVLSTSSEDSLAPNDELNVYSQKEITANKELPFEIKSLTPQKGNWILVKYLGKKMERHYVGEIIEISSDSTEQVYKVKFLKTMPGKHNYFVETEKDQDYITESMIIKVLEKPKRKGTDKRYFFEFPGEDFSRCHW